MAGYGLVSAFPVSKVHKGQRGPEERTALTERMALRAHRVRRGLLGQTALTVLMVRTELMGQTGLTGLKVLRELTALTA